MKYHYVIVFYDFFLRIYLKVLICDNIFSCKEAALEGQKEVCLTPKLNFAQP